ncbi:histidine phosphatase family protein [Deinococcus sp.]|uniref:histidine phosphatase family protein n=1 Tax=Deinococcus sp. TaxID=47478 RepID=UPI0025BBD86D|nr:histidine phosphatase family protein [Deinococcus sp.]
MSELILIRHGQATPFEADTDRLSPLGEQQARTVGEALHAAGVRPTHVLHGSLVRQLRSAQLAHQPGWPGATPEPRLAEFDGDGLAAHLAPILAGRDPAFSALAAGVNAHTGGPERNRAFQTYLEALAAAWQAGTLTDSRVEPWAVFRARVQAALADMLRLSSGSTVLAFTSGGVIGLTVALTLDAPDASALALNWRVKNASVTRLTFGGGRVSLDTFNETHHLPPHLHSWR